MEFQKTGRYYLTYKKTKGLGWKETQEIQYVDIEDSQGNRIVEQSHVLKFGRIILRNYTIDLIDQLP